MVYQSINRILDSDYYCHCHCHYHYYNYSTTTYVHKEQSEWRTWRVAKVVWFYRSLTVQSELCTTASLSVYIINATLLLPSCIGVLEDCPPPRRQKSGFGLKDNWPWPYLTSWPLVTCNKFASCSEFWYCV